MALRRGESNRVSCLDYKMVGRGHSHWAEIAHSVTVSRCGSRTVTVKVTAGEARSQMACCAQVRPDTEGKGGQPVLLTVGDCWGGVPNLSQKCETQR